MQTPFVGLAVIYRHNRHSEPQAAIVTKVHSDAMVNLAIFNEDGSPQLNPPTSILFLQEGSSPPSGSWCSPAGKESSVAEAARAGFSHRGSGRD